MHAVLSGELAVVVHHGVQGNVAVGHVVAEHGRPFEHSRHVALPKGRHELAVHLADPPGKPALLGRLRAAALQVLLLRARDSPPREIVEGVELEVVIPVLVRVLGLPEVGVDGVCSEVGGIALEQLPERLGQRFGRLLVDEAVNLESPRGGERGQRQEPHGQEDGPSCRSRDGHYCRFSEIERGRPSRRPSAWSEVAP